MKVKEFIKFYDGLAVRLSVKNGQVFVYADEPSTLTRRLSHGYKYARDAPEITLEWDGVRNPDGHRTFYVWQGEELLWDVPLSKSQIGISFFDGDEEFFEAFEGFRGD